VLCSRLRACADDFSRSLDIRVSHPALRSRRAQIGAGDREGPGAATNQEGGAAETENSPRAEKFV